MCAHQEAMCPTGSTVNADIRIPHRKKRKPPPSVRLEKTRSVPAPSRCPARIPFRVARSAGPYYLQGSRATASARSVARPCTPAGTALTLRPQPASSAPSQFRSGSQRRMRRIGAPSFPCGFALKKRLRLQPRLPAFPPRKTPAAPSKISSKNSSTVSASAATGFHSQTIAELASPAWPQRAPRRRAATSSPDPCRHVD